MTQGIKTTSLVQKKHYIQLKRSWWKAYLAASPDERIGLINKLARQMKDEGWYSPKTGLGDVAWSVQKLVWQIDRETNG